MDLARITGVGSADQRVSARHANADHGVGLVCRYEDGDNYLSLRLDNGFPLGMLAVWLKEAGAWTRLSATLAAVSSGDVYEFSAVGTELRVSHNGEPVPALSAADGHFRDAASAALELSEGAVVSDFAASAEPGGPPPPVPLKLGPVAAYYPDDPRYADAEMP